MNLSLGYQSPKTNSKLIAIFDAVFEKYKHHLITDQVIAEIKQQLDFLPETIKKGIRFNFESEQWINLDAPTQTDSPALHHSIFKEAIAINSKRRGDYNAGRKFVLDYQMLFEFYTGYTITSKIDIHFSGMKFKPNYTTELITWQSS